MPSSEVLGTGLMGTATESSGQRRFWLKAAPPILTLVSVLLGIVGAVIHWKIPSAPSRLWFTSASGWELSAFGAFSAMSGFGLASLALVAGLSTNDKAKEVLDSNAGRGLVRRLLRSTWWWMAPATTALLHIYVRSLLIECAFVALVPVAIGQAAEALLALTVFFRRWTIPVSE